MIFIVAKFKVRAEYRDTWLERVRAFTEATRAEPGNLWFEWSRTVDDPDEFVLVEAFRDGEAGAAHVKTEHFTTARKQLPPMLAKTPDVVNVEIPGTEWSALAEMAVPDEGR
jgi:quinol monooxygenase YgiN